jgi:Tol biopolymer transport system component
MRAHPGRMTALIVGLAAAALTACRDPEPPVSARSETAPVSLELCQGLASEGVEGKIAFTSDRTGNYDIFVMNADCTELTQLTHDPAADWHPAWSPDGTRLAFAHSFLGTDIFIMNADGTDLRKCTDDEADDHEMSWSPDGTKIAFASNRTVVQSGSSDYDIFVMNADCTGLTQVTDNPTDDREPAWSPDGTTIAFSSGGVGTPGVNKLSGNYDIFVINPDGRGQRRLTYDRRDDQNPAWSPDGTRIAWKRDRAGADKLLVMNADGSRAFQLVTDATGGEELSRDGLPDGSPAWSPDGSKLVFSSQRTGNTEILLVNADGSGMMKLTDDRANDDEPAWHPRRTPAPFAPAAPAPVPALPPTT